MFIGWRPASIWSLIFLNLYLPQFLYCKLNFIQTELSILITLWVGYLCNQCFSQNFANGLRLVSHKGSYFSGALFIGCFISLPHSPHTSAGISFSYSGRLTDCIKGPNFLSFPISYSLSYHLAMPLTKEAEYISPPSESRLDLCCSQWRCLLGLQLHEI